MRQVRKEDQNAVGRGCTPRRKSVSFLPPKFSPNFSTKGGPKGTQGAAGIFFETTFDDERLRVADADT